MRLKTLLLILVSFLFIISPAFSAILLYEDFEDALDFTDTWKIEENDGTLELSTEQVRTGSKSCKFSLTGYDSGDDRVELLLKAKLFNNDHHFLVGSEYWFGFSIFLADDYQTPVDQNGWILHYNFHSQPDGPPRCDPFEGWARKANFQIQTSDTGSPSSWLIAGRYASAQCSSAVGTAYYCYPGAYSTGCWNDFVINTNLDYDNDGFIKIWKDGVLILDRTGGTCYNDALGPYLKFGIYSRVLDQDQVVTIYYDEFRIGDSSSSYAEVVPGGSTLPILTTQAVTDITTTTAIGHGTITNTGGENATKRGICWNITGNPTVADDKVEEVGNFSTGAFSGNMTGLTQDQHYYVKPYGYNTAGYGYGDQAEYDTNPDVNGTYILDNGDTGTSSTGTWSASGGANPYGIGSLYSHGTNSTYTWEKTLDGNYTTSIWWTEYASRSTAVTVKIYDSGDNLLDTKSVNQQANGGQWNELGTYDYNATAKVVVLSTGGGPPNVSTCADAVKFDYVEGSGGEDSNELSRIPGIHAIGCEFN